VHDSPVVLDVDWKSRPNSIAYGLDEASSSDPNACKVVIRYGDISQDFWSSEHRCVQGGIVNIGSRVHLGSD